MGAVSSQVGGCRASNPEGALFEEGDQLAKVAVWGSRIVAGAGQVDSSTTGVNGDSHDNSATEFGAAYVFDLPLASCELSLMTTVLR